MLFGVKGKFHRNKIPDSSCVSVIHAKRNKHSSKPTEQYVRIESISAGPYLEMFARTERNGWDAWGNDSNLQKTSGQTTLL
jgi:N6-adenosine-specific RNA methylase IME4